MANSVICHKYGKYVVYTHKKIKLALVHICSCLSFIIIKLL